MTRKQPTNKMRWKVSTELRFVYFLRKRGATAYDYEQASVYDTTRRRLLRGREDMLGLVAAQLKNKVETQKIQNGKAVWVDVSSDPDLHKSSRTNRDPSRSVVVLGKHVSVRKLPGAT